jgi:predicted PurR-regulated permease PerM
VIQPETNDTNNNSRQRWSPTIKAIIGVIVFVLVALAIFRFSIVFVPLIIGGIMAYIFQPVVTVMHDRLKVPRGLATALIYLILLGILVPIGISLTPVIIRQIRFLQNELIGFIRYIQALSPDTTVQIMELDIGVKGLIQEVTSELTKAITATAAESITVGYRRDPAAGHLHTADRVLPDQGRTQDRRVAGRAGPAGVPAGR